MTGDPAYSYLNYGIQGDPTPHFSDWLGYPLVHDNTWSMGNPPLDYTTEQPVQDFTMPSPSYVSKPSGLLGSFERIITGVSRAISR